MIKPAKQGTLNVLKSVLKSRDTVKRVILTSSFAGKLPLNCMCCNLQRATYRQPMCTSSLPMWCCAEQQHCLCLTAAMVKTEKGPANGKLYTDADWNDESKADKATCYYLSKVNGAAMLALLLASFEAFILMLCLIKC